MSNPIMRTGPITCQVKAAVSKFHVVALDDDGIAPAAAAGPVFGAVTESGGPSADRQDNNLTVGVPDHLAVHVQGVVPLTAASGATIAVGAPVFAAANGEISEVGDVKVGVALGGIGSNDLVRVLLTGPSEAAAGGEG